MDNTPGVKSDPEPLVGQVDFDKWANYTNEEDVVNKYFYKLYVSQITTDQMIDVMKHLSTSPKGSRNLNVYNTMLKILFNECRFFPKYPVQELSITAELFGKMIKHGILLSNKPYLILASRCILEALKRGKTTKMFQFGTIALSQFENSIASYPWFSNSLLNIPDVKETFPQLYKTCEKLQTIMTENMKNVTYIDQARGIIIGQAEEQMTQTQNGSGPSVQTYDMNIRSSVGEWESLMGEVEVEVKVPPEALVDHIYSIFNNMCPDDVEKKAKEVSALLSQEYNSWLLLYIIRTRASKENNLQELFANFIGKLNYPKLFDLAIQITYTCINACLQKVEQHKEVPAYRTLLKNLGSWLGRITLYRNMPIIHRQLDVKKVLTNGYERGYLLAVLPFIVRIMENIKNSKIFKPPNPWTVAILNFLMEIRDLPNLKTNLVFEVEVLFKNLNLEMGEYRNKTKLLTDKKAALNSPDFENGAPGTSNLSSTGSSGNLVGAKGQGGVPTNNLLTGQIVQTPGDREKLNQLLSKVIREGTLTTTQGSAMMQSQTGLGSLGQSQPGLQSQSQLGSATSTGLGTSSQSQLGTSGLSGLSGGLTSSALSGLSGLSGAVSGGVNNVNAMTAQSPMNATQGSMQSTNLPNTANFTQNQINMSMSRFIDNMMYGLHKSVVISTSIALFEIQPQLRALVPIAIERAVRQVLSVVSNHSLSLARMCTKVLITKDFKQEEDENVTRAATRMMFECLATNLVVATCKEPLRVAFHESLRSALQTHRTQDCNDQVLVEQLVQILSLDVLGVCVNVVEKITQEYAIRESDFLFMEILKSMPREQKGQTNFMPTLLSNWNTVNQGNQALTTYKTIFNSAKTKGQGTQGQTQSPSTMNNQTQTQTQQTMMGSQGMSPQGNQVNTQGVQQTQTNGLHSVLTSFEECLSELREPLREVSLFPPPSYNVGLEPGKTEHVFSTQSLHILYSLPHDHDIFSCIIKCLNVVETSGCREVASMAIAKCLLLFLCEGLGSHAGMNVEVLLCILDGLNSINPGVKQMLGNMLYSLPLDQNNNLFNVIVVPGLLRYKLLEWPDLTHYLVLAMERGKNIHAIEMAIVATAIALVEQKSAPPTVGASLVREIANISVGSEPCKTYPGLVIKDAKAKLLKDFLEVQNEPKPTILVLTAILKQNLNTLIGIHHFKLNPNTMAAYNMQSENEQKVEEAVEGFGGARRIPLPCLVNDSHRFVFGALFGKWVEGSKNTEGDALLLTWRQFFQKFNLQSLFKMEGGTDSFFASCLYTIIHFEKSSKLFSMTTKEQSQMALSQANGMNARNGASRGMAMGMGGGLGSGVGVGVGVGSASGASSGVSGVGLGPGSGLGLGLGLSGNGTLLSGSGLGAGVPGMGRQASETHETPKEGSSTSTSSSSSGSSTHAPQITLFDCFEGLCKMVYVMLRLVGGEGDIPPCSALQKLLSCLSSIIVHEGHYVSAYNIWLSLMVYFDKVEEANHVLMKITFLNSLEYVNPTRVPGFSFFYLRLLVHPSLLTGSLKSQKCWGILARIFNLLSIYTTEINNYSTLTKEQNNNNNNNNNSNNNSNSNNNNNNKEGVEEKEEERETDYVDYFTSVYFNCIEYVANLSPEFVSVNYLNFFGTFAIERLASSIGTGNGGNKIIGVKGVDLLPEMKIVPKISNSWTNHISRNRTSLLVLKVLNALAKYGPSALTNCQDLETLCYILNEESNNTPAQSVMTFNSLTLEIVNSQPNLSAEHLDSNARLLLFLWLIKALPIKAKYQLICSITRHLRGPNAHTFFFSCLLITTFEECKNDPDSRQVILRVLLESFIAPGQCPWGVSLVVLELFRNPRFQNTTNYSQQTNELIESITHTINNITV